MRMSSFLRTALLRLAFSLRSAKRLEVKYKLTWIVQIGFLILHDIAHFLKQYSVLSFDLSITTCKIQILLFKLLNVFLRSSKASLLAFL